MVVALQVQFKRLYQMIFCLHTNTRLKKYLAAFHEIIAVSESVKDEFVQLCPEYMNRVYLAHNIVDQAEIIEKSCEVINDPLFLCANVPRLLTVGRFTHQKGFDFAIETAAILKQKGIDFCWFFIGTGEKELEYRRQIDEYDLSDCVIILGRKDNPYPYMKKCDIYVQPSRHEAYAMTILEAKTLHKPIVCNRFAGAEEQVIHGVTGYIVSVGDIDDLAKTISCLLAKPELRNNLVEALRTEPVAGKDWDNIKRHF